MTDRRIRISIVAVVMACLLAVVIRYGCERVRASDSYAAGDTVKVAFARMDTLFNGTDEVVGEVLKCYRWFENTPTFVANFTEVAVADSGIAGFYWASDSTDAGQYFASWTGSITGRTPVSVYNFEITSPPSGPNKVTLWFLSSTDSSGIADTDVRIKDENQTITYGIYESDANGKIVTALPADTAQVIASKLGHYTFTVPEEIIVTASGLTDTIFGIPFDPGTPDSADVTYIYGWARDLMGGPAEGVVVTVSAEKTSSDWGSPDTEPTLIIFRGAVMDTTDTNGKFNIPLVCADKILPEGGSVGTVRHIFEFSRTTRIGPYFVSESDTLYIPCAEQSYVYWDTALRP